MKGLVPWRVWAAALGCLLGLAVPVLVPGEAWAVTDDSYGAGWSGDLKFGPASSSGVMHVAGPSATLISGASYKAQMYNGASFTGCAAPAAVASSTGAVQWVGWATADASFCSGITAYDRWLIQATSNNAVVKTVLKTDVVAAGGTTTTATVTAPPTTTTATTTTTTTATVTAAPSGPTTAEGAAVVALDGGQFVTLYVALGLVLLVTGYQAVKTRAAS